MDVILKTTLQVPPPVPKKPNVLLLPSSVHSSTNCNTERQTPQTDSPVGLQSPAVALSAEEFPSIPNPNMPELDENHFETDEESSKELSLQSSLQDSSLTELEEKMASTEIGMLECVGKYYSSSMLFSQYFRFLLHVSLIFLSSKTTYALPCGSPKF